MSKKLWGKLVGDRGYLSQALFEELFARGLQSVTPIRKRMQNRLVVLEDKLLTRKRFGIGAIVDQLKNSPQIEHTRQRSPINFAVNLIAGLIAYTWQPKKPSLHLSDKDLALLPTLIQSRFHLKYQFIGRGAHWTHGYSDSTLVGKSFLVPLWKHFFPELG